MLSCQEMPTDLIARPVVCLCARLPLLVGVVVQAVPCGGFSLYQSFARIRLHRELFEACAGRRRAGGGWPQKNKDTQKTKTQRENKKVPRGEARHCSVRGRRSRRDEHTFRTRQHGVTVLAVVTASTSRALSAGRAAGDDPVSPGGHEPARLMPPWPLPRGSRSRPSMAETGSHKAQARAPSGARGFRPSAPA
jgi:hypothetical protein